MLDNGKRTYAPGTDCRAGRSFPSIVSSVWRSEMAGGLRQMIDHIQRSDYAAHVFGYMITGLMTEEWYHWSIHTGQLSDYSAADARGLPRLAPETLRRGRCAFGKPGVIPAVSFATAAIPSRADRMRQRERTFRDPARRCLLSTFTCSITRSSRRRSITSPPR